VREKNPVERWSFHLSGGRLCVDLANTVSWRGSGRGIERLSECGDLVEWARQAGVLTAAEARRAEREARSRPAAAARMLTRTRAFREAIYRIFRGIALGVAPRTADLARLDRELHDALRHLRLARKGPRVALVWSGGVGLLARPLWAAARSAADVLVSDNLRRLKTCGAANCGWVFLDTSRSGTRRWCAMEVCGSRAKARSYYARLSRRRPASPRGPRRRSNSR